MFTVQIPVSTGDDNSIGHERGQSKNLTFNGSGDLDARGTRESHHPRSFSAGTRAPGKA